MREQNSSSLKNLKDNLKANKISFTEIPLIFQYNKRDLREILPIDVLNRDLNPDNKPFFPTIGTTGENILEALHTIMKMVIIYLKNKLTVFQKDKTVMFSREEATDTILAARANLKPPPAKETNFPSRANRANEDTEKEDLFELSTPMPIEEEFHKTQNYKPSLRHETDEEIFNLGDDSMLGGEPDFLEIPEANLKDELGESREDAKRRLFDPEPEPPTAPPTQPTQPTGSAGARDKNKTSPAYSSFEVDKVIEVPLQIEIPDDRDEVRINFNLQLVIKRK
jgi:hypothetical protein